MRSARTWLISSVLTLVLLAGCLGGGDEEPEEQVSEEVMTESHRELEFTADPQDGEAPINVTFTADVAVEEVPVQDNSSGSMRALRFPTLRQTDENGTITSTGTGHPAGNFTWSLLFGDGSDAERGDQAAFPLSTFHDYAVGGTFNATLTVGFEDGEILDMTLPVNVTVPPPEPKEMPDQLVFEFGPSLGCTGDIMGVLCISYLMGPGSEGIDGFWIPLDERYWGLSFTSDNGIPEVGDTDALFVDGNGNDMPDDANNGSSLAQGKVPKNAAWLFVYNYATPSPSMTVTFS